MTYSVEVFEYIRGSMYESTYHYWDYEYSEEGCYTRFLNDLCIDMKDFYNAHYFCNLYESLIFTSGDTRYMVSYEIY